MLLQGPVWRLGRGLPCALPLPASALQCFPPRLALGGSAHLDRGAVAHIQAWRGQSSMCCNAEGGQGAGGGGKEPGMMAGGGEGPADAAPTCT